MSTPDVYAASLERRIAALEATLASLPHGEQNVPNYVVTDANGAATGLFPGGVEINAPVSVYTAGAGVGWRNGAGGALIASIFALPFAGDVGHLTLNAFGPGVGSQRAQVAMVAQNSPQNGASFTVGSGDSFGDQAIITMAAGLYNKTLLRDNGSSDFVGYMPSGKVRIAMGRAGGFSFGGSAGAFATCPHGMGVTPDGAIGIADSCSIAGDGNAATGCAAHSGDNTNVYFDLRTPGYAASSSAPSVNWLAWTFS